MSFLESMKKKAKQMKSQIGAIYYVSQDRRVGTLPKVIIGFTILYALSPIDLIPDFIPIIGYFDDLIIVPALIALAIRLVPNEIWKEAQEKAQAKPIVLGKNWTFAVLFIAVWLLVIWWVIASLLTIIK